MLMINSRFLEHHRKRYFGSRRKTLTTLSVIATALLVLLVVGIIGVMGIFAWYAKDLPRPDKVKRVEGLSTVIYDRNGVSLYDIYQDANRLPAKWEDIPDYLKKGTIAVEDKEFYKHPGISTAGIVRAMVNIVLFHNFQGGSTLTQQLVKTVLLSQERTLPRKIKEAILAIQIERKYKKDDILLMYLNEAPYGGPAVGVETASEYYFGKPVKNLGLIECAFLSGLPQSPSRYSPFTGDGTSYVWRTEQVLRRMREDGYISKSQEESAKLQLKTLKFVAKDSGLKAPHFISYIKDQLIEKYGEKTVESGGLRVTTTLDWALQDKAQSIVAEEIKKIEKLKVSNGAAVVIDPKNGEVLAMIGSKDYNDASESGGFKFNVSTQGMRQPGSAIKPISYAVALKRGYTPASLFMDVETHYPSGDPAKPDYNPKNYTGKYLGPVQMRYALGNSINTVAVKISALVGLKDILKTAYDMGIPSLEPTDENMSRFGLSLTLGGGEVTLLNLTGAYGVFADKGLKHDLVSILKVTDSKGKVLEEHHNAPDVRVLPENVCYLISGMLSDNEARKAVFGDKSYLVIPGHTVAVKTGTTDDKRDNWTVGYTKSRVVGVWVGNNDNSPMNPALASGITGAAPIWNRIIREAIGDETDTPFDKPDDVKEVEIDAYAGGLPVDGQPTRKEYFITGTEPLNASAIYKPVKISRHDNKKLASQTEIVKGEYDTKTYLVFTEQDPVSGDGKNRWQEGIDAWVAKQTDDKFHPPTDTYQSTDEKVSVRIREPGDTARIDNNTVTVRVAAASTTQVKRVEIFVDGSRVRERTDASEFTEKIDMGNGQHTIKAKAMDKDDNVAEHEIHIGVNEPYASPTPRPTDTPMPSNTPQATNTPVPTP